MSKLTHRARAIAGIAVAAVALAAMARHADAIVASAWWHGLADLPGWVDVLVLPAAAVFMIGLTVEPSAPRWVQRSAAVPTLAWATMLLLCVGRWIDEASGVPTGVLVLGALLLLPLGGLVGMVPAGALWACCVAGLLHGAIVRFVPLGRALDALFVFAGAMALVAVWGRLFFPRPAPHAAIDDSLPAVERNPREEAARREKR